MRNARLKNFISPGLPVSAYWRVLHGVGFGFAVAMLGTTLYLQLVEFVMPCLFCVYLRVLTLAYGVTSFLAILHKPYGWGQNMYRGLFMLYSVLGIAVSGYLIGLQIQPTYAAISCGRGIGAAFIDWPLGEILVLLFASYGDCAQASWTIFGLSLPLLSLYGFIGLGVFEIGKRRLFTH